MAVVSHPRRIRRATVAVAAALCAALAVGSVAPVPTGAASPTDVADDRFDAITGPLGAFVVRPDAFGMDASRVLADVPALVAQVDGDRARALVTSLAFPRTSSGPVSELERATDLMEATFRDAGYEPQFQSVVLPANGHDMPNVYAELPGTSCPSKVLVVGAHYDSATQGNPAADDNASGVGGLFELARVLRDAPLPVTVRFVAFSYEEDGLVGSRQMAQRDVDDDVEVVGALSLEMIGYTADAIDPLTGLPADYLAMVSDPASAPMARAFGAAAYTYLPEVAAAAAVIDPAILPDIYRSDHASYAFAGFPGLMATDTANFRNPNYHTVNDTLDTIDWAFLTSSTQVALAGVATYASSDQDLDGVADLCSGVPVPTTSTPASTPLPAPSEPDAPASPPARPIAADVRYTG